MKIKNNQPDTLWMHCPGKQNPADIPSRGIDINKPESRNIWLFGPDFLLKSNDLWPKLPNFSNSKVQDVEASDTGEKNVHCLLSNTIETDLHKVFNIERYGSIHKLLRVTCYVLRFVRKSKERAFKTSSQTYDTPYLQFAELEHAKQLWILNEQKSIIKDKRYMKEVHHSLGIYKDEEGLLRLRGRLQHSELEHEAKYPIYLDKNSYLTRLLILDCHEKVMHCKVRDTLTELRSRYWVCQGRRTVKRVIRKCITCNKSESRAFQMLPAAPLPDFRVKSDFPFTSTGIDYLGSLLVKSIFTSNIEMHKVHVALYTCASSRAVHLDLVPDISCVSFVRSLKRFISRYGVSKMYISDNATCFIGPELTTFINQMARSGNSSWKLLHGGGDFGKGSYRVQKGA